MWPKEPTTGSRTACSGLPQWQVGVHAVRSHLPEEEQGGTSICRTKERCLFGEVPHKDHIYSSHKGHAARAEDGSLITFCSDCGAYETSRAVLLKDVRRPETHAKRQTQWTAVNFKRIHPASKKPMDDNRRIKGRRIGVLGTPPIEVGSEMDRGHSAAEKGDVMRGAFSNAQGWILTKRSRPRKKEANGLLMPMTGYDDRTEKPGRRHPDDSGQRSIDCNGPGQEDCQYDPRQG
jgi:hypothetical protein